MYAVSTSDEGDCYLCLPPDPGGGAAALGACEAAALGADASAAPGTGESALSGTTSAQVFHTFTLDSGASRSLFRDRTTLTPLSRPVAVSLADPSGGPVLASFSTVLPCLAAPSGTLSGLYLPSFSTNLVSGADLQDQGVDQFTPASQRVTHCTCARTGRHLATFTRPPGSSLYTLSTESPSVPASGQVAASSQVFAAASGSGPESAPCSCRLLSHQTLLWHHRLGHPSLPRLRGMASRVLVSGFNRSLPPLPPGPAPTCVPCVEGRQRAAPHSSEFPPKEAPLQTLHMDVWGPARVRGQGHERYFLLVVDDYSRYTTMFPLRSKGYVAEVLIDWIRAARLQLRESFGSDFPVLRLHSHRGGEFSSAPLGAFCRAQGIRHTYTLPASPQQNGIAERRIGMVMDVARTSMIHAAAPHFLWPFAVQYAAHQLNLQPRVSAPETSPTLRWTGKVGDASAFRVWGSRAFVRDLSADKLSPLAVPCVFLGFPPDARGWQFYHPTSRRVLSSQDVTFDESVPYYRLFPYRTAPLPPPPLFLAPGPPPIDPLPPQGPAPSRVFQVDAVEPVEEAVDSGTARGAEPVGAGSGGAEPGGAEPGGAESGGAKPGGAEPQGAESWGAEPGGAEPGGAVSARVASRSAWSRRELLSPQELREWFARRWSRAAGAGGPPVAPGPRGARTGGTGAVGTGGAAAAAGVDPAGASGAAGAGAAGGVGAGVGAAGASGAAGAGAAGGVGAGVGPVGGTAGAAGGTGVAGPAGVGAVGAGGAAGTSAVPVGPGGPARPRPYFVPLLEQVLGLPPSPGPAPPLECPQPVHSQSSLQPVSPFPAPSPYAGPTGGLAERREPASRPASPVRTTCTSRRAPCLRPPAVPGTHQMMLRPSTAPLRVPLPSPPASSLPVLADPPSDSLRAASPTVARLLSTVVTVPSFESTAASALVAKLVDFAARCRLDYAASLVADSVSVCPPSVGGECALSTNVLEDRQEEFQFFAGALPHLVSTLIAPEGDPDAPDIPTPRSYAEAIEGPYSSQWQSAMDAEMASWKSTGTYVDDVPPPGANIVGGMWIFRVKRPPGSSPVFKARYVARGFSQRQGVDYFQTFSLTRKMTTLRVLLHVAALRDFELHSLDFGTAFLQGSLHEEIWLRRPPGFTGSFPPGTQWRLRRPVYSLRQAPREWHDTLRTTLAALWFAPSTADPSLFLRTDTSLPLFYILVYEDDFVFATADTARLAHVKSELQKRHTCTDLGELRSYLGLQITRDRAQRTITLTRSHMVQQVLQRFDFTYSSPQATPLSTRHSLSALPSDESVEPSGPYPELVGCLMYLMTCTRPDLAYPLSILARYVAPGRHRPEHMAAAKRVLRYLCNRGAEFSSARLGAFCRAQSIRQTFTLPASPQQNGIAERRIGMVMDVARTSMIHAAAPHFLWPFAVQYAAHQLNLQPRVSLPETSPTLLWTGKVGDASAFRFYHPTSRRVLSSQDVTFDESVPYYRLFPYRTAPLPPPPLFLAPGPPPVDPLPPQGPAPSSVSQVDALEPVEVAGDSGAATGAEPVGARSGGTEPEGAEPGGAESGGAEPRGAESEGPEPGGAGSRGAELGGTASGGAEPGGAGSARVASRGATSRQELLSPQELCEWFARRWSRASGAAGPGAAGPGGPTEAAGVGPPGGSAGVSGGTGAAGSPGTGAAGATGFGAGGPADAGTSAGAGVGAAGAGGAAGPGAPAGSPGAVPAGSRGATRPRPYFVPLLEQVLGLPPSPGPAPPLECPQPVQSQSQLRPVSPLPTPPYAGPTGGLAERRAPASRPASPARPACTSRRTSRPRPPPVPGTHQMTLRPSTAPLRVPLPSPPASSLPAFPDPESDSLRAASPTVALRSPGSPPVFKARYVARGFSQRQGVDYFQTFSPTPKMTTLRVLPHIAAQRDYELHSLDFSTAFLQGSLHEEIWLRRPPGFTGSFPPGTQWSLRRPVYGLRQAPREWHDTLRTTLAALGFAPSTADPSLFLRTDTSLPLFYVLVYVDDLVFATADTAGLAHMKSELQKRHTCTDLGELRSYLGLQITRDRAQRTITLTQSHMVQQVLQRFDFTFSSPQATPLSTRHSLSALPSDESVEPSGPYPELVGCLMYLMTCTRPDLAYPFSILARYVAPGRHRPEHMAAAKRVLRYLCSTSGLGLVLGGRRPVVLRGHADTSWADDQATQRSFQGYTFSLGSGSVSWRSTRSSSVLSSSCEAEIYAGAMAAQELRWLTYLLTDLGEQPRSPPVLYVDNKAMLALCREHRLEHRTKHIDVRYFLARELQQRGQLRLAYVASQANTADIFTKALPPGDHQRFCTMLGLVPTWPHLLTS
ncbi:unnamed protein product [Closterium sp. NIES-53]